MQLLADTQVELAGVLFPGGGNWQRFPVLAVYFNSLIDDIAEFPIHRLLIDAMRTPKGQL